MRNLVFTDPLAKHRLEAIVHPLIRAAAEREAQAATGLYVIFVVPLLIESGTWRERVARIVVIDCAESTQVARVMARNGLSEAQVRAIMANQVSRATRLAAADDVIVNDAGTGALIPQVEALHAIYRTISATM
jgi:dephospho-CoA kinase